MRPKSVAVGVGGMKRSQSLESKTATGKLWETVELRPKSDDWVRVVEEIVRIEKRVFPKHESLANSFQEEVRRNNTGLIYSQIGGEIAGYVIYSWPSSLYASITKLAVKEKFRGHGLGEALLKAGIEKCKSRSIHRVWLHVDPSRAAAVNLYKKLGFQVDSIVEGYYSLDRNAHRMYLDFSTH